MTSYESAILLAKTLDSKKGEEIKVLKTEGLTTLADYFVICTATSNTQVKACLLYTSPSPRDGLLSRMPSSA